jgi:hypothetical protein
MPYVHALTAPFLNNKKCVDWSPTHLLCVQALDVADVHISRARSSAMHSCKHTHMYMYRHTCSAYKRWMWPMCMLLNRGTSSKRRFTLSSGMRKGSFSTIGRSACVEHVCVCVCVCVCVRMCVQICECVCVLTNMWACVHVCAHIYTRTNTHTTHTHEHTHAPALRFCSAWYTSQTRASRHTNTHLHTHNQTHAHTIKRAHPHCALVLLDAHLKLVAIILTPEKGLLVLVLAHELERVVLTANEINIKSCAWAWKSNSHCADGVWHHSLL